MSLYQDPDLEITSVVWCVVLLQLMWVQKFVTVQ